jgi:putative endonuclease
MLDQKIEARRRRGAVAHHRGMNAERLAEAALHRDGWRVLARRLRTPAGEIDLVADRDGLTALIEVKARPSLAGAAFALQPRQQARLMAAGEIALANNPGWGSAGVRFDVLLVDKTGAVRRVKDAFRAEAA